MLLQRDQFSHRQLPVVDQDLILKQHSERVAYHPYSVKSKVSSGRVAMPPTIRSRDLVYLYGNRNKSKARDRLRVPAWLLGLSRGILHLAIAEAPPAPCPPRIDVVAKPLPALCPPHDGGTEPGDSPPGEDVPARASDAASRRSWRQRRAPQYLEDFEVYQ
ncbi:hypothetical protein ABVT39_027448 [Epinephelus coioides]